MRVIGAVQRTLAVTYGRCRTPRLLHFAAALPHCQLTRKRQRFGSCQAMTMQLRSSAVLDSHRPKQAWRPPTADPRGEMGPVALRRSPPARRVPRNGRYWGSAAFHHVVQESLVRRRICSVGAPWPWLKHCLPPRLRSRRTRLVVGGFLGSRHDLGGCGAAHMGIIDRSLSCKR